MIWVDLLYVAAFTCLEYAAILEQDKVSDGYRYSRDKKQPDTDLVAFVVCCQGVASKFKSQWPCYS